MAKLLTFRKLFRPAREEVPAYKQFHYLNKLAADRVTEILLFSEEEKLAELMPDVAQKKVLFLSDQKHRFSFKKIQSLNPGMLLNYVYENEAALEQQPNSGTIYGNLKKMPLKHMSYDVLVCPLAIYEPGITAELIASLSQVVKNGGRVIISIRHPQLEHVLYNQNPAQNVSLENSLSAYFKIFKNNNLYTEEIEEGFVDTSLKPFFTVEGEYDHYHEYKGLPLTLRFRLVKFVRTVGKK